MRIVVANYEADAQLAKLAVDRAIDEAQHPFAAAAAREAMDETAQDCSPLFAPGSSEHQAYVLRTLAGGRFALGMAAQVVGADPVWQPAMLGSGARRCVEC